MTPSQTSASVQLDQLLGHLFHLIQLHLTTFYEVTLKQLCIHGNHVLWIKNTNFLWGHVKTVVYSRKPCSLDEHKVTIKNTNFLEGHVKTVVYSRKPCSLDEHKVTINNTNFLEGQVKRVVYSQKPRSLDELKVRIKNTIHEISQQQLKNAIIK